MLQASTVGMNGGSMRNLLVLSLLALALSASTLFSQVPVPVDTGEPIPVLSANELDGLVAPIALYPDPLISQILVASTYPLQIVEAYQWLQRNPGLSGPALTQAAQEQNWDPSIQALVVFPDVLRRLNEDVNWTTNLGSAFMNQQADVMSAVQRMRLSAEQSGRLYSTPQQQVINTTNAGQPIVEIVPANPEVIYVPAYDPAWVWGPAVYYRYPRWYYPPAHSGIFFNVGISIGGYFGHGWGGWGGWGWRPSWGSRTVVVNNTFIRQNNFNTRAYNTRAFNTHITNVSRVSPYRAPAWNNQFRGNAGVRENFTSRQNFRPAPAASAQARAFAPSRMNTYTPPARVNSFASSRMSRPAVAPSYSRPSMPMARAESGGGSMPMARAERGGGSMPMARAERGGGSMPMARAERGGGSMPMARAERGGGSMPMARAENGGGSRSSGGKGGRGRR
jgi:hypothetical protein